MTDLCDACAAPDSLLGAEELRQRQPAERQPADLEERAPRYTGTFGGERVGMGLCGKRVVAERKAAGYPNRGRADKANRAVEGEAGPSRTMAPVRTRSAHRERGVQERCGPGSRQWSRVSSVESSTLSSRAPADTTAVFTRQHGRGRDTTMLTSRSRTPTRFRHEYSLPAPRAFWHAPRRPTGWVFRSRRGAESRRPAAHRLRDPRRHGRDRSRNRAAESHRRHPRRADRRGRAGRGSPAGRARHRGEGADRLPRVHRRGQLARATTPTLRRSQGGPPAAEDIAADPLVATKPDNRKGLTPEFAVQTALKLDEEAVAAVAAGRVHGPPRRPRRRLLLGHERARQPQRSRAARRDPARAGRAARAIRPGRRAGLPGRADGDRRPRPADDARRRLAEAAVGGVRGSRQDRQAARPPTRASKPSGPRSTASCRSRSRRTRPTRFTAPSTSPRSSS